MDITDTQLQAAQLLGAEGRSDEVRGARLAALQTALLKASAEEGFPPDARLPPPGPRGRGVRGRPARRRPARLHAADPELYPRTIWADWLCGDHSRATGAGCWASSPTASPRTARWWRRASWAR
ncbi:hypothetical protein GCM10020256_74910 [Streptomyces thermocoprophilus]